MNTKKILNDMTLLQRYNVLEYYRSDCFKILNRAIPDLAKRDVLLTTSTIEILKDIKEVIENDINTLKIEKINLENILGKKSNDELSELIKNKICLWTMTSLERDYQAFVKAQELNKVWSKEDRYKEIEKLDKSILELEESINILAEIDSTLVKDQYEELDKLKRRKEAILGTLNYKTKEEIQVTIYGYVYSFLNNILENVQADIKYLERFI